MDKFGKTYNLFKRDGKTHKLIKGVWTYEEFEYLKNCLWLGTEKVDGTNMRMIWNRPYTETVDGEELVSFTAEFEVRGRSDKAEVAGDLRKRMHNMFPSNENMMEYAATHEFGMAPMCFYGEGFGPGIQNGGKYGDKKDFVLFDIKVGKSWLPFDKVVEIGGELGIPVVPTVACGTLNELIGMVESGLKSTYGNFTAEGLVVFPIIPLVNRWGERIRAKIKGVDYE